MTPHHRFRFPVSICAIWLGLLTASCQPILLDEGLRLRVPSRDVEQLGPVPRPVPEIAWSALPQCESQAQNQGQSQQTVCTRLLYRADTELRELIWSNDGIQRATRSLADVPDGIISFSPDFTRLIVQTPRGHTAGGPLYLYDLETGQLRNLNEQLGLPLYTGVSALRVAGWHPDGQQLLLVNEDDEVTIWLDLVSERYQAIALGIDTGQMAPPRHFMLAPDGSGFTFESHSRDATNRDTTRRDTQVSHLYWHDLTTGVTRLLLTVPAAQGRLDATTIAPDSEQLAYLLLRGDRAQGRSEEVHLLELTAESADVATSRLLLAGNLGPTRPVWSPDGKQIALIRRNLAEPLRADPNQPPPLGDIWTISTRDGTAQNEATQLTFTEALERPPVWSPDGRYLAFVTADGRIGMVATADPGVIWQLDELSLHPQFIQLAFAPLEQSQ